MKVLYFSFLEHINGLHVKVGTSYFLFRLWEKNDVNVEVDL